jgi:hypothetical protein
MKKNADQYDIYPLVVEEGKTTTIYIKSKSSCDGTESGIEYWPKKGTGGQFNDNKQYSVKVTPREIYCPKTDP